MVLVIGLIWLVNMGDKFTIFMCFGVVLLVLNGVVVLE